MATWNRLVSGSTAGNISLNIDIAVTSCTRTSNTNVRVTYGIRFSMSSNTYTHNSIAAFCPSGGSRYYAFNSGSGKSHTNKGTYYYANTSGSTTTGETCPFTIDIPVTITQTSATFKVGYGWNGWTPSEVSSSTITVTFPTGATAPTGLSCSATPTSETSVKLTGGYTSDGNASVTSSGFQYSTNGSNWTNCTSTPSNLSANTKYYFRYYATNSQGTSYSGNSTATTYEYPYLTSVPEFTVGNSLTIGIYNPLGRSCVISVVGDNGTEYTGGTITGTNISGFNNSGWLNNWYATLPSKISGTYKARLKCTTGNVNQLSSGTKYSLNTSDEGFKPTFTVANLTSISNSLHTDINGTDKFIKNHNSLSGTIKPMTANRSSSGNYYNISSSGLTTVKKDYSSSNVNFTLGNMSTDTFNVTAVDSRGFSTTVSKTITLIDYFKPSVTSAKITRQNGIGDKAILSFSGKYTNWSGLSKTNSIQSIKYKIGSGSWKALPSSAKLTSSNGTWILNATLDDTFSVTSTYSLYLQITDLLETVTTNAYTVSTADAFIWKDLENKRIGIGKKPDHALDVNGNIRGSNIYPTGQVKKDANGSWIEARNYCSINNAKGDTSGSYSAVVGQKTKDGHWTIGRLNENANHLEFVYVTDKDYNNKNNVPAGRVKLSPHNGSIITTGNWLNVVYPVGSIYIGATEKSPASLFGGTWTQLKNRFLFATNATRGNKGKDAASSHTGTAVTGTSISTDQMPAHSHSAGLNNAGGHEHVFWFGGGANSGNGGQIPVANSRWGQDKAGQTNGAHDHGGVWVANSGGGKSHNHSVSYIEVYVWQRTA